MDRLDTIKTINVLAAALLIVHMIGFERLDIRLLGINILVWIALFLVAGSAFESRITTAIAKGWMKFGHVIGTFNSKLILTIIFFVVLTPIAFLFRLFNKHLVDHFKVNNRSTYFDDLNKSYEKSDFEKLW
jgi:hypothetical protein